MKNFTLNIFFLLLSISLAAQINYTANDQVAEYDETFRVGVNPGYNGSNWSDEDLAVLSAGSATLNVPGVGMMNFRASLPEMFHSLVLLFSLQGLVLLLILLKK